MQSFVLPTSLGRAKIFNKFDKKSYFVQVDINISAHITCKFNAVITNRLKKSESGDLRNAVFVDYGQRI